MKLSSIRKSFDKKRNTRDYILQEIEKLELKLKKNKKELKRKEKALLFVEDVAIQTQMELSEGLQDCVAAGLNSVFDIPYGFKADFKINRGRPECHTAFLKKGRLIDPMGFSGGGEVDVAAFAARVACLSMAKGYRKLLLIDEPFIRLKGESENKRVIALMHELSHRLGIQMIVISDERAAREDILDGADRSFYVDQKGGKSYVQKL